MNDPRTSTAIHHLPLDDTPPSRLAWSVVSPDPSGRVQLPPGVVDVLGTGTGTGPARARVVDGVLLLLSRVEARGRRIGIDRRGRVYVPVWLRRPALVVVADPGDGVVVVADVAILDPIGERLLRAVRA